MPKMGDTMEEGKILTWRKQEGERVERGEALAEIETEKTNIEAEAFASGTLRKILVPVGQTVPVGAPIALIGEPSEPLPDAATGAPAQAAPLPAPDGQAEVAPQQTAPQPVAQPLTAEGHTRPEQPVAAYAAAASNGRAAREAAPAEQPAERLTEHAGRVFISPIARRIAQEHHLEIGRIPGTGPSGRILREDVEMLLARQEATARQPAPAQLAPQPAPVPAVATGEEVEAVPLTAMRKAIARRLAQSMQTAPHFYVTMSIDTTRLAEFRATVNGYAESLPQPLTISYNDLIVKGAALALARMPEINVSFDGENLLYKKRINVGVAVALERGLIVPVIRDADKRGLLEIAREARRLVEAARAGKLKPEEFSGGTFSVSNLGMVGVEEFTAIINPPESAILAVGAIAPTPVVVDGQVAVRERMKVTLSVDHRAIDGAQAARFLQELKRLLEQPMAMML